MNPPSRRSVLRSLTAAGALGALGAASGCGSSESISTDPRRLVMWSWTRAVSPELLAVADRRIPGSRASVRSDIIGGDFDTKLRTTLAGDAYIPDLSAINSNCSLYFPNEALFTDFNDFGAKDLAGQYYDWKWKLGTSPTGRQIFWPMDIGPTGFFYREDVFAAAGVPSDPAELSAAITTWDDLLTVGKQVRTRTGSALVINGQTIFDRAIDASPQRYFDAENRPLFDRPGSAVRKAWDVAVEAIGAKVTANLQSGTDQNAAWANGKVAGNIGASWWAQTIATTAPGTKGRWRMADQPERPGSYGGSFLAVPKACQNPRAAVDLITWLTSPDNQARTFGELQLFPSTPASFTGGLIKATGDGFFGPQSSLEFFSRAAEKVPTSFVSTYESQVTAFDTEIVNVEAAGKDPERAWRDAVDQTNRVLHKRGVI